MIYLSIPHLTGEEQTHLQEVFESNWITTAGSKIDLLEDIFSNYLSVPHAVALNSGTSAIHLGLKALGVEVGDHVICPTFTFVATANPILYQQAIPIFVDSEYDTWNICPKHLTQAIEQSISKGKKPKVIIVVHLYGQAAKMKEIIEIAQHYDIPILEDAAEALGAKYQGKALGSFGDVGVISLNGNKIITASGGGILTCYDKAIKEKVKIWATQSKEPTHYYFHKEIGYNTRMSNVLAAIACGQMEVLEDRVQQRKAVFQYYQDRLGKYEFIHFWEAPQGWETNSWLSCMLFDTSHQYLQEKIRVHLLSKEIETRYLWNPLHIQPLFEGTDYYGNGVGEDLFKRGLCLPSSSSLSSAQLDSIIEGIEECLA